MTDRMSVLLTHELTCQVENHVENQADQYTSTYTGVRAYGCIRIADTLPQLPLLPPREMRHPARTRLLDRHD